MENEFVCCQARFEPFSVHPVPLMVGSKKPRAEERKPWEWRTLKNQMGGNRGILITRVTEIWLEVITRNRRS